MYIEKLSLTLIFYYACDNTLKNHLTKNDDLENIDKQI